MSNLMTTTTHFNNIAGPSGRMGGERENENLTRQLYIAVHCHLKGYPIVGNYTRKNLDLQKSHCIMQCTSKVQLTAQ